MRVCVLRVSYGGVSSIHRRGRRSTTARPRVARRPSPGPSSA